MKRLSLIMAALLTACFTTSAQQTDDSELVIRVSNEREFVAALGPERTVELGPNVHLNLTSILDDERTFSTDGRQWLSMVERGTLTAPTVVSEDANDGRQLTLVNMRQLTIRGTQSSSIVVEPRFACVLNFVDCENIVLENLTLGHTPEGYCMGSVVNFTGGRVNMVKKCDLYGCGSYGLTGEQTNSLSVSETRIHDCTYGIMSFYQSPGLRFTDCDFHDNGQYTLVEADKSDLAFTSCRFFRNDATQLLFSGYNGLVLLDCDIYHPTQLLGRTENLLEPREPNRYHDADDGYDVQPRAIGPDISLEEHIRLMQAQAICGTWRWTDADGVMLYFTIEQHAAQLFVMACGIYGSTEFDAQCTYADGVLHVSDDSFSTPRVPAFDGRFELNPRGDLVGTYKLRLNGGEQTVKGNITLRKENID